MMLAFISFFALISLSIMPTSYIVSNPYNQGRRFLINWDSEGKKDNVYYVRRCFLIGTLEISTAPRKQGKVNSSIKYVAEIALKQVSTIAKSVTLAYIRNDLKIIGKRNCDMCSNLDRLKISKCK